MITNLSVTVQVYVHVFKSALMEILKTSFV